MVHLLALPKHRAKDVALSTRFGHDDVSSCWVNEGPFTEGCLLPISLGTAALASVFAYGHP